MSYWQQQQRQPKPRPQLDPEHELAPRHEGILKTRNQLGKNYHSPGDSPSRDTILFDGDPERRSIPVPNAAMIIKYQSGYPLNHPSHPAIKKFDSRFPASDYYFVHAGPVPWIYDSRFRHIPTYSRYVIDAYGRVLNAHNGKPVEPEKGGYNYKLVADGPINSPYFAQKEKLMILAWTPLPEDFVDYGMGTYSHVLDIDTESGTYGWQPRPGVTVRNNRGGDIQKYRNLPEFVQCAVNDFKLKPEFRPYIRNGLNGQVINIDVFSIKETDPKESPEDLSVFTAKVTAGTPDNAGDSPAPTGSDEPVNDFDTATGGDDFEDIDF